MPSDVVAGYQSRRVWCSKQKDPSTEVSEDLCDGSDEPAHTQTCASVPCPPQWTMSDWSMCSVTCGEGGSQIRQISCEQVMGSGQSTLLNDSACTDILGAKPATTRPCPETLPCPGWHLGPWKSCDRLCGDGKQRRAVHCFRRVKGKVEIHPDLACSAEKPPSEKDCNLRPCEGVDWVTSDWSGCSKPCGGGDMQRKVLCFKDNAVVNVKECKPETTLFASESCNTHSCGAGNDIC
ncbi:hypothetical protein AAG570_003268 [Ranatra chinensis]|uniref:Uncharacterized protein n=1 Tax=Ranatra chinensis TaxID=642074 RepID=A0ABD0Y6A6_9HEMI